MTDETLLHLMIDLVSRIRDLPETEVPEDVRQRCIAVIAHLTDQELLPRDGTWHLGVRK